MTCHTCNGPSYGNLCGKCTLKQYGVDSPDLRRGIQKAAQRDGPKENKDMIMTYAGRDVRDLTRDQLLLVIEHLGRMAEEERRQHNVTLEILAKDRGAA